MDSRQFQHHPLGIPHLGERRVGLAAKTRRVDPAFQSTPKLGSRFADLRLASAEPVLQSTSRRLQFRHAAMFLTLGAKPGVEHRLQLESKLRHQ